MKILKKKQNYREKWTFQANIFYFLTSMEKLNESNLSARLIDLPNVQLFIVIDAFVNLVWFEAFRCTTIHNFGDFGGSARLFH